MKLINSTMNFQINTEEGFINSLVIENRDFFRSAIEDIYNALAILAHIDDTAMSSAELMQFLSQLYQPSIMETKLWNLS